MGCHIIGQDTASRTRQERARFGIRVSGMWSRPIPKASLLLQERQLERQMSSDISHIQQTRGHWDLLSCEADGGSTVGDFTVLCGNGDLVVHPAANASQRFAGANGRRVTWVGQRDRHKHDASTCNFAVPAALSVTRGLVPRPKKKPSVSMYASRSHTSVAP